MFAKRLLQKAVHHSQHNLKRGSLKSEDLDVRVDVHYGVPSTASILAFDSIQRLLAVGTLDGRIKVIGGDNIEGMFISPKQLPYKYLEFIQNQGFLIGITNDNDIQVWDLEDRSLVCSLEWESNITAFSIITGSKFMYIGDEYGSVSVMKYEPEKRELLQSPYKISPSYLAGKTGLTIPDDQPVVGILPQPSSSGLRFVIAYENGLMIFWDAFEAQIVFVGGSKDLQLKDTINTCLPEDDKSCHYLLEKEISAYCWASRDGSILAVGYIDGDILFWRTSAFASFKAQQTGENHKVARLQLSSADRRLPVIVLHWSSHDPSKKGSNGRLFVYGGDEMGSEEVLTVLSIEWTSGVETLRCTARVDLALSGSYADSILFPNASSKGHNHKADIFVLTNPGKLYLYDEASLSTLLSQNERKLSVPPVEFPLLIPTAHPSMTVARFYVLPVGGASQKGLLEVVSILRLGSTAMLPNGTKWPLSGGVPSQLSSNKNNSIDRVYIAGYEDGSVRMWDASFPVFSLICILEGKDVNIGDSGVPVSMVNFCCLTSTLAVGNKSGLVFVYHLNGARDEASLHYLTAASSEVGDWPRGKASHCKAVFSLVNSPIQALEFGSLGARLAIGFGCGRIAMIDINSSSVLYLTDSISGPSSPLVSLCWIELENGALDLVKESKQSETEVPVNNREEFIFVLTKDAKIITIDACTGQIMHSDPWHLKREETAVSMYVSVGSILVSGLTSEKQPQGSSQNTAASCDFRTDSYAIGSNSQETENLASSESVSPGCQTLDALVLLCCEKTLCLYSLKSVIKGNGRTIQKANHAKPCCWVATLMKDGFICGILLLFQTGDIEIRSFPDLDLVEESSIMSMLRWSFKPNMGKSASSDDGAYIVLENGCEVGVISILAGENCFRIPESLPSLHDRVLAAAATAAFSVSSYQKKKQEGAGIFGGIIKGCKGEKVDVSVAPESNISHLEDIFSNSLLSDAPTAIESTKEEAELNIDDIEIDDAPPVASSSHEVHKMGEREKLLGMQDDGIPKRRTVEEIQAKYGKAEDATSAAGLARNKLMERQEKLERISRRTEDLQSGAEDFASLANELVKTMERRKWWHI